jgi:ribose/xylose/arabinose/galactoside ABC-type transport system permease subunit
MTELDSSSPRSRFRLSLIGSLLGPFLALGLVFGLFGAADMLRNEKPSFFTERNVQSIAVATAMVGVASLGMTVVIISGGIDLSAGTAIALSSTVLAAGLLEGWPPIAAVAACIGTGLFCGFVNGVLIGVLRVVPFIVTLGTMTIFLGLAKKVARGGTIHLNQDTQVPEWLMDFLSIRSKALVLGFPLGIWVLLVLAVLTVLMLRYTVFSRYVFALGSNESTARLCGINITLNKIAVYTLSGFFVGIAGLYLFAQTTVGDATGGTGKELVVIAAVVIGGGSLSGGRGSVMGTLTGAAIIFVIQSGCTQLGIGNAYQDMILGLIIISAVMVDQFRQRRLSEA